MFEARQVQFDCIPQDKFFSQFETRMKKEEIVVNDYFLCKIEIKITAKPSYRRYY